MGRGNVCVHGDYEGLWYVDRDCLDYYTSKHDLDDTKVCCEIGYGELADYEYDYALSEIAYDEFVGYFVSMMEKRFGSFAATGDAFGTIMENNLFEIKIEDNEWSYAIMLIQKEGYYDECLFGLQKKHYQNYLNGMKDILLGMFTEIGYYNGPWTHGIIKSGD